MRIAILDTGVDTTHPDLKGQLVPKVPQQINDFVDYDDDPSEVAGGAAYGHGTHVAGLVAMVAPDAKIMPVRVFDADGVGNAWVLAEGLLYAIDPDGIPSTDDGAHIINLSLGSLGRTRIMDTIALIASCGPNIPDDAIADRTDPGYNDDALRCQTNSGAIIVAAAGNDGSRSVKEYPAAEGAFGLIPVSATTSKGALAMFSNSGSWIDLAAPGDGITSTIPGVPGGGYATWSGTSMAAPFVAGTAALVRARFPTLNPRQVAQRLKRTAASLCTAGAAQVQIDAAAAVTPTLTAATPLVCK
jgi:subtilisin family serine protease